MATAPKAFTVALEAATTPRRLVVAGELDLLTAPLLERSVQRVLRLGADRVYLDLRRVEFVDVAGLRSLLGLGDDAGGRVVIIPSPALTRIVELALATTGAVHAESPAGARASFENWQEGRSIRLRRRHNDRERSNHVPPSNEVTGVASGVAGATAFPLSRARGYAERDESALPRGVRTGSRH